MTQLLCGYQQATKWKSAADVKHLPRCRTEPEKENNLSLILAGEKQRAHENKNQMTEH
jgi:hypothetical protein